MDRKKKLESLIETAKQLQALKENPTPEGIKKVFGMAVDNYYEIFLKPKVLELLVSGQSKHLIGEPEEIIRQALVALKAEKNEPPSNGLQ